MKEEQQDEEAPLLGSEATGTTPSNYDYGSVGKGYSTSPQGLAAIVAHDQLGAVKAFGGPQGLMDHILSNAFRLSTTTTMKPSTSPIKDGLPLDENNDIALATTLQKLYGTNALPLPPEPDVMELITAALEDPTMLMLVASAIVSLILGLGIEQDFEKGWIEGTSIIVTVCLVVAVSVMTDYSKAQEFRNQQLQLEDAKHVLVLRNAAMIKIHPRDLLVGDIVRLAVGDIAPADGILFQASKDFKMDESALTGETDLIAKQTYDLDSSADPFIVSGTNVMQGTGLYLVLAVGASSIQGKILARIREQDHEDDHDDIDKDGNEQETGFMASIRAFFTFGGGDDDGATLMEKLDNLAVDIGKLGLLVALAVFLVMLAEFLYTEFILQGPCSRAEDTEACNALPECHASSGDEESFVFECRRHVTVEDVSVILDYFITAITILVVAVPEGLPLAVTLALAVSMKRMMKDNNQVKHMDSTETMGSATTICSDKTGTLTENKMTTMKASYGGNIYEHVVGATSSTNVNLGSIVQEAIGGGKQSQLLAEAVLLNVAPTSNVTMKKGGGEAVYEGNPTDCALIKLTMQLGFKAEQVRDCFRVEDSMLDWGVHANPFSSERKRMSWIVQTSGSPLTYPGKFRLYCKGAPQQVFDACSSIATKVSDAGTCETAPLDEAKKQSVMDLVSKWQDNGLRTLALAYRDFTKKPDKGWENAGDLETEMTLLAVVAIEDPLRASVPGAIAECHKAGIDVRMCTGDALSTAIAIAKGCNILRESDLLGDGKPKDGFAMTGAEFDDRVHRKDPAKAKIIRRVFDPKINDAVNKLAEPFLLDDSGNKVLDQAAFDDLWPTLRVLARCQPEDKLTLVRGMRKSKVFLDEERCGQLQREHGIRIFPDYQVVAVTGDGTNDAPALKSANVGFAMGIAGTETAKQACDIILLDDNFASIIKAVMWGRNVFDSISKFIQFQLTVNVVAITLAVVGAFTYSESPLSAVQMLWVNMIMDSLASLALATEQPTKELLDRMPYGKRRPVISPIMIGNIVGHSMYQIAILCWVLFKPETLPLDPPIELEPTKGSLNWSVFFNVFVMLQLFNEFNARRLPTAEKLRTSLSEWNIFQGLCSNPNFVVVMVTTFSLQIFIMEFGGEAVNVVSGGLTTNQWVFCVAMGAGSLVWQLLINALIAILTPRETAEEAVVAIRKSKSKWALEEVVELDEDSMSAKELAVSNWDKLRLGVRRDILYARVFRRSVRTGGRISAYVRCSHTEQRDDDYYRMLADQLVVSKRNVSRRSYG